MRRSAVNASNTQVVQMSQVPSRLPLASLARRRVRGGPLSLRARPGLATFTCVSEARDALPPDLQDCLQVAQARAPLARFLYRRWRMYTEGGAALLPKGSKAGRGRGRGRAETGGKGGEVRSARFASLPPWHLCSQLTRKRRETRDQQQLVLRSSMRCLFRRQPARTSACHCQPGTMPCADASSCDDWAMRLLWPPG